MRLFESLGALVLILFFLPQITVAIAGLALVGTRPLVLSRHVSTGTMLRFNAGENAFGSFLRRFSIDRLAALLGVISGRARLADAISWITK